MEKMITKRKSLFYMETEDLEIFDIKAMLKLL